MILNPRQAGIAKRAGEWIDKGCIIIDFETTGFPNEPGVGIVEVAVIDQRGGVLMNTLVNPGRHIPSGASRVHGIYDRHVKDAPTFPDVFAQLNDLLHGQRAIAYNHSFEMGMLSAVCKQHNLIVPTADWNCAMRAYATFRGRRGFAKLSAACATEGITVADAHRALGDCKMTLALIYTMAALI